MEILGDRRFVEVPGSKTHELPPLLVRMAPDVRRLDKVMGMANDLIEQEDMIAPLESAAPEADPGRAHLDIERRKMDLALNLVDQYLGFVQHWQWGNSILEWIRQCETTFETRIDLRNLLRADLWPHAGRSSFVMLLEDNGDLREEELKAREHHRHRADDHAHAPPRMRREDQGRSHHDAGSFA